LNLLSVYEQTGKMPKDLRETPIAIHERWLWNTFWDLSAGRQSGFGGPLRISYPDFAAYAALQHIDLEGWEIDSLREMDAAFLAEVQAQQVRQGG
jgi:hypothetical protein